jgi:hypothetical protein
MDFGIQIIWLTGLILCKQLKGVDMKKTTAKMSMIMAIHLAWATLSLYGEESYIKNNIPVPDPALADTIRDNQMKSRWKETTAGVKLAQADLNEILEGVRTGSIEIQNNHGIWCAVLEDETTVRQAIFASQDKRSRITHLRKRVWADSTHGQEIHDLGYEIFFDINGCVDTFMTRDGSEMLKFFPDGRLNRFSVKLGEGQYSANWDISGKVTGETKRIHGGVVGRQNE